MPESVIHLKFCFFFLNFCEMPSLRHSNIMFFFQVNIISPPTPRVRVHNNSSVLCFWSLTVSTDYPVGCCSLPGRSWDSAGGLLKHWEPCLKRQATRQINCAVLHFNLEQNVKMTAHKRHNGDCKWKCHKWYHIGTVVGKGRVSDQCIEILDSVFIMFVVPFQYLCTERLRLDGWQSIYHNRFGVLGFSAGDVQL